MPAVDIAKYLDTAGILDFDETGITGNTFIDNLPAEPDTAVGIYTGSAGPPDTKTLLDRPGLQFIVRAASSVTAYALAVSIRTALHAQTNLTLTSGLLVRQMTANQSRPVYIGTDENGRHQYSVNISLLTRR